MTGLRMACGQPGKGAEFPIFVAVAALKSEAESATAELLTSLATKMLATMPMRLRS